MSISVHRTAGSAGISAQNGTNDGTNDGTNSDYDTNGFTCP